MAAVVRNLVERALDDLTPEEERQAVVEWLYMLDALGARPSIQELARAIDQGRHVAAIRAAKEATGAESW